jgi:hypothetical protein
MLNVEQASILADADRKDTEEQRKFCRHMCIDSGALRLAVRPEFRGRKALLIDVSTGGIGFVLQDMLDAETVLAFEMKAPSGESISRLAKVRHCRPTPTPDNAPWIPQAPSVSRIFRRFFGMAEPTAPEQLSWFVGCEFDRSLSEAELAVFLASLEASTDQSQ